MIELIKELKEVMEDKYLSAENTSHFIRCSTKTIFRWLYGKSVPSLSYQRKIRNAIEKIKETYPEIKEDRNCPLIRDGGCGITGYGLYKGCTLDSPEIWAECLHFGLASMYVTGKPIWGTPDKQIINKLRQLTEKELLDMGERL